VIAEHMRAREGEAAQVSIVKGDIQAMTPTGDGYHITIRLIETGKKEITALETGAVICSVGEKN